jgi:GntR family transcriptional regulator/MocR family aminotransferase
MGLSKGPVDVLIALDRDDGAPLREQLERTLRDAIREGRLGAGTLLPSSRGLAAELGVSRGVVTAAYGQLVAEGYLASRQGALVRVAPGMRGQGSRAPMPSLVPRYAYDFSPGLPDLVGFPRDRWLRSLRGAWRERGLEAIGSADPRGVPELRDALADYLGRVRGTTAEPEHLLVCTGFRQALSLTCRWLKANGIESVALEEPGWHPQRLIVEEAGLTVTPIRVDDRGIDVDELRASGADAVVVTPAHQFPTGVVLSPRRRAALIDWAERGDRLIIEDDYDGELCEQRVGALQGLAPDRVLYIGSASKRLTPGLRLGWMLPPSWLSWSLIGAKAIEDGGSELAGQLALADFIARSELDRHLRRMRLRYARRRQSLLAALLREQPDWQPRGTAGGLHTLVELPADADEPALLAAAARDNVGIEGLSLHSYTGELAPGLVLGHAHMSEAAIKRGVQLLGAARTATRSRNARPRYSRQKSNAGSIPAVEHDSS